MHLGQKSINQWMIRELGFLPKMIYFKKIKHFFGRMEMFYSQFIKNDKRQRDEKMHFLANTVHWLECSKLNNSILLAKYWPWTTDKRQWKNFQRQKLFKADLQALIYYEQAFRRDCLKNGWEINRGNIWLFPRAKTT